MDRKPNIMPRPVGAMEPVDIREPLEQTVVEDSPVQPIGKAQLKKFTQVLREYNTGLKPTKSRIISSENWWKLRNGIEEEKTTNIGSDGGFTSKSGWLHNVIVSKHADAMEAYPQPSILPREVTDRKEAQKLSAIVPCILEQNGFERTYSDVMWQKTKTGTGAYKITWDPGKLNGLGDISIEKANLLNLFWEPGVDDIQKSRYFFHTELVEKEVLAQQYPQFADKFKGQTFISSRFLYDDHVKTENRLTVIDVYYHKYVGGKKTLQYCKYVADVVLRATENEPELAERGLYDHGLYPYDFDPLYPIEGSPCGYGYVDVCLNPQTEIDMMKTSFVKNAMVGATPRYFERNDGSVNETEFMDLSKAIVHVNGNLGEDSLRQIVFNPLDGVYVSVLDRTIQELRETSGNTETSTGTVSSGVTSASGIAALQEASGKGSRDSTKGSYRSYERIVKMTIELIRQFYDLPRQFRIVGKYGMEEYTSYSNIGLKPQHQGNDFGEDMGFRMPVFDIKVSAQKKNVYTSVSQNELALQFFKLGFFDPRMVDQAMTCLDLMDFDGKDAVMQKVVQNGTMFQKLIQYMQMALMLAQTAAPHMVQGLSRDIMQTMGGGASVTGGSVIPQMVETDNMTGTPKKEHAFVEQSRQRAQAAAQPSGGGVMKTKED